MRDPRELARGGVEGRLPSPRTQAGVPPPPTRRMLVVQRGSNSRARPGACSVYESDSAGPLDDRHESRDRQAPRGRTVGAGVVAAFMPKRNSALVGTTAGRSTMRRVWRLANRRSHAGGAARPRFRFGTCPAAQPQVGAINCPYNPRLLSSRRPWRPISLGVYGPSAVPQPGA